MKKTTQFKILSIFLIAISFYFSVNAFASTKAPELTVSEWINSDPGPLNSMKGKVVVIDFFQMWCPGCNNFSIPLMFKLEEKYKARKDVVFLSMHTVFEGHAYQTPDDLKEYVEEKGIKHPVGIDDYASESDDVPITMRRYRTGGTPCIAIIGKKGNLRFKKLGGFNQDVAEKYIDILLSE